MSRDPKEPCPLSTTEPVKQKPKPSTDLTRRTRPPTKPKRGWWIGLTAATLSGCGDAELEEARHYRNPPGCSDDKHPISPSPEAAAASPATPRARKGTAPAGSAKFIDTRAEPTSTFGLEVGTASYTRLRASLQADKIPGPEDVRVEEMLNHFRYSYAAPHATIGVAADVALSPWGGFRLVRIGIKGRDGSSTRNPSASRETIAKEVKAEVRWNPEAVRSYRLVGYESSPSLESDSIHGGKDIAAGHTLTAFYEVDPVNWRNPNQTFGTVVIRSKSPAGADAAPTEVVVHGADTPVAEMSADFRFAVSVIAFGLALDKMSYAGLTFEEIEKLAQDALGEDSDGQRAEFVSLVRKAKRNWPEGRAVSSPARPGLCYLWQR